MLKWSAFFCLLLTASALPRQNVDGDCPESCKLPTCQCSSTNIPNGIPKEKVPQIVMLTFDDAVSVLNYNFYEQAFFGKKNPDGCPISTTYFVSHEYTDYSEVHDLYERGHEIAIHSISHTTLTQYWKTASVELLKQEFGGEKELIAHFANIPTEHIQGLRIPFLQMSGDNSTKAMKEVGLKYDCSWPTHNYINPGLWPYTLDYPSMQDCSIGPCPTAPAPGIWIQPMINWQDNSGVSCAMTDACVDIPEDVDGLFKFMVKNFEVQYKGNRAPFGFYIHAAWFSLSENHFEAYKKFVDYLLTLKDVYIVDVARALEYAKNPQPIEKLKQTWPKCNEPKKTDCIVNVCKLMKGKEERYMTTCVDTCPDVYPWVGNPLGKK